MVKLMDNIFPLSCPAWGLLSSAVQKKEIEKIRYCVIICGVSSGIRLREMVPRLRSLPSVLELWSCTQQLTPTVTCKLHPGI